MASTAVVLPVPITVPCSSFASSTVSSPSSSVRLCCLRSAKSSTRQVQLARGRWQPALQLVRALVQEAEPVLSEAAAGDAAPGSQDSINMFLKAEGNLSETAVPKLQKLLESQEGVSDVKVFVSEGCATVELHKQSLIQQSGVASGLVELIQSNGFKMQALILGFDDDDESDDSLYEYDDSAAFVEEEEAVSL